MTDAHVRRFAHDALHMTDAHVQSLARTPLLRHPCAPTHTHIRIDIDTCIRIDIDTCIRIHLQLHAYANIPIETQMLSRTHTHTQ